MDLRSEQRRAARGAMTALIVCATGLALAYTILPRWFHFPVDLPARLAFALRAELFVLLWVVLGVVLVALGRGRSAADIGGAALTSTYYVSAFCSQHEPRKVRESYPKGKPRSV